MDSDARAWARWGADVFLTTDFAAWLAMLLTFVVFASTGGSGVSSLLTASFFACFALFVQDNPLS